MRNFNVGIIGCGVISRTYAADILAFYHHLKLTACAASSLESARKLASEFGIPKACTVEELLADPEIEIVIDLTPPQLHEEINRKILSAGKHLFSEKPFAHSLHQTQELIELAREKNVKIGSAPDTFLASGLQSLRYYLDRGLIGKPFFVTANMTTFGVETWHPNPALFYKKGAGPVFDMGPYYISAIVSLLGPIESIYSVSARPTETRYVYTGPLSGTEIPVEIPTHYASVLTLKSGVTVNLNLSFDIYKSNLPMFEIYGTEGTLSYPDPNFGGGRPRLYRKEQYTDVAYVKTEAAEQRKESFCELPELFPRVKDYSRGIGVLDLAAAVEKGEDSRTSPDFIAHVTEALEGILLSAETRSVYKMKTNCERPKALVPGKAPDQV